MEEVLPPQTRDGAGFEPTQVRQFTIFLENRVGRLVSLVRALESGSGKVVALSIEESADTALVRLICSDPDHGRDALKEAGFSFSESDLLIVELPKRTRQPLIALCAAMLTAEINIHYAYPLLIGPHGKPALALYVEDHESAVRTMQAGNFTLFTEGDLNEEA